MKSDWFLSTTCSGDFIPLLDVTLSDMWGLVVALEASDSLYSGDVMVGCYLLRPRRSAVTKYIDEFDILLLVPIKACVQSSGWRSASSSMLLRPSATRTTRRIAMQQGLCCVFFRSLRVSLQVLERKLCEIIFMNTNPISQNKKSTSANAPRCTRAHAIYRPEWSIGNRPFIGSTKNQPVQPVCTCSIAQMVF